MRRVGYRRRALGDRRLADDLAPPELVAGQVDVDSRYESVPHVPLDALSVEIHVCPEYLAADQIVDDQRGDVALTATRVLGRPSIIFIGRVQTPGFTNCLLKLRESEHSKTVMPNASVWRAQFRNVTRGIDKLNAAVPGAAADESFRSGGSRRPTLRVVVD